MLKLKDSKALKNVLSKYPWVCPKAIQCKTTTTKKQFSNSEISFFHQKKGLIFISNTEKQLFKFNLLFFILIPSSGINRELKTETVT